mgnify:FL=1
MKVWKMVLGFLGLVGGLFAAGAAKSKEVKKLKVVIKENKKEEKKVEKQIKELETTKTASKKEVGNLKRKLTNTKKKTKKMEQAYENNEVDSAEDFLRKFSKEK